MSRIAYVNGQFVPHRRAAVHVEDRGYQFADGVYEVIAIRGGRTIDEAPHHDRLERSLREMSMAAPMGRTALSMVIEEVVRRNRVRDGIVYLQITRGVAPRDHQFPPDARPAIVLTARNMKPKADLQRQGVKVITVPDIRWKRPDIKTISLLPNCLGKQTAVEAGAYEAWQVDDDGNVTEGTATNAWIVTGDKELVTRQADTSILNGVTRLSLQALAARDGLKIVERPFSVGEAKAAKEAFLTSTTSNVMPVVQIDEQTIGNGHPGSITESLSALYELYADG